MVRTGTPELVLVAGYSGIGKSAVVHELHKALVPPRGLFAAGKFDQYRRDVPYATVAQAFRSLVRHLLGKRDAELAGWRDALTDALGPNAQLIVDLVPELKLVVGEPPPVPALPPQDAQGASSGCSGGSSVSSPVRSIRSSLFLDDLQWLDAATLDGAGGRAQRAAMSATSSWSAPIVTTRSMPRTRSRAPSRRCAVRARPCGTSSSGRSRATTSGS